MLNGKVISTNIRKTDIGRCISKILIENGIVNQNNFEILAKDKSSSFELLKLSDQITDNERQYRRYKESNAIEFSGKLYYVSGNWGENNLFKFIKFLETNFPQIQINSQSNSISE